MENNRKAYTYVITNLMNGKVYVGKTLYPEKRWRDHKSSVKSTKNGGCSYLRGAIVKHGIDNFKFAIHTCYLSEVEAYIGEVHLIAALKSNNTVFGYNLTQGGDGVLNPSESTRNKARLRKHSDETKNKIRMAHTGMKHSETTKAKLARVHKTIEFKAKMSRLNLGVKRTEETKSKIRRARAKQVITKETIEKIRFAHTGRKRSDIGKANMRKAWHLRKQVALLSAIKKDPKIYYSLEVNRL